MISNKRIYGNSFWMMSEKIISMFGLIFVTSFVAKYVGAAVFGEIALAMAIFQIVQIISQMGGDNIIFKRVSKNERSGVLLIKASSLMRFFIYMALTTPIVIYFYLFVLGDVFIYVSAVAIACLFSAIDMPIIYYNARLLSKFNAIANIIGLSIGLFLRYLIALLKLEPSYLAIPIVLTTAIPFFIRYFVFKKTVNIREMLVGSNYLDAKKIKKYSKYMLLSGVGIVASSISVAVYSRVNQFVLNGIDGASAVGIYSVALTVATSWIFISQSLITSFFSKIYNERDDKIALNITADLNRLIFGISILFVVFLYFFGNNILLMLYGAEYASAYFPMIILSVGALFSSLGTISYRFIVKYSGFYFLSKKMFSLLLVSVPLSYLFISHYGIIGASWSVVVIELLSLTLMNYLFKKGLVFKLHVTSLFKLR